MKVKCLSDPTLIDIPSNEGLDAAGSAFSEEHTYGTMVSSSVSKLGVVVSGCRSGLTET